MANNDSTTTHEELAGSFPITTRPFAVWFDDDLVGCSHKWQVNNKSGESIQAYADFASALKFAAEASSEWDNEAKKQTQVHAEINGCDTVRITMINLPPDILEHFYDLRALAMSASALSLDFDKESDELNAVRRVLKCLEDKALKFANEADEFLINNERFSVVESEAQHA